MTRVLLTVGLLALASAMCRHGTEPPPPDPCSVWQRDAATAARWPTTPSVSVYYLEASLRDGTVTADFSFCSPPWFFDQERWVLYREPAHAPASELHQEVGR